MHAIPPRPSLVTHSADFMREALRKGEWTDVLPSERTLCTRLRISRPTLRAVLALLEKEKWIGPVENRKRRILVSPPPAVPQARTTVVVLLTPVAAQWMPPFVLFWMDTLRELLAESSCQLEVQVAPHVFEARPDAALKKLAARLQPAAWVLFRSTEAMQRWFATQEAAVVIAGSCAEGVKLPSVDIDYRAACRHAANLLRRQGHVHLALLLPNSSHGGDVESELGFREGTGESGRATVLRHREQPESVIAKLEECLQHRPAPTALVVARSVHVLTVLTHLLRQGRRVPGDVALISRDDDAFLDHAVPKASRYATDPVKFARQLSRLVLDLVRQGRASTRPVRLIPSFQAGQTTTA